MSERERAESALQSLFDWIPVGLYRASPDGQILEVNPALVRTLGYSHAALMTLNARDLYAHLADWARWKAQMERDRSVHGFEVLWRRADGEVLWVRTSARVVRDADGTVRYYEGLADDISETRKAEEVRARLAAIVDACSDAIVSQSVDGVILSWNKGAQRIYGYSAAEAVGIYMPVPAGYSNEISGILPSLKRGERIESLETVCQRKDGRKTHVSLTILPVMEGPGNLVGVSTIARDLSDRRRADELLRRLNENLEGQAKQLAQALHDEAGQLLTSAHLALAEAGRDLAPPARERLQQVRGHLDQIEEQLRRLAHELRPRILDDLGLVPTLESLAEGVGKRRGISVTVEAALQGRLPAAMETVLYWLAREALTNASKHARATRVVIRLEQRAETLDCSIRDDGIGFDAAAVLAQRGEPGLGLLGIRDRLKALGGTLQINSSPGQGTELVITIPLETLET